MARRRYLVTYDVSDDKRRTGIFHALRDRGDHAQYSVFFCELNPTELAFLRIELRKHLHEREDQILILDLGNADNPLESGMECLGKGYEPPGRVLVV